MRAGRGGAARPLDPKILRAYDIRGIVGESLSEADAGAIGRAFGTVVREGGGEIVCVGYDGRLHSPKLEAALVDGLASTGARVIRVGLGPTPMLYFAVHRFGADAGVMVSGSHNPPDHNGFKLLTASGAFHGEEIRVSAASSPIARSPPGEGRARTGRRSMTMSSASSKTSTATVR